jgi:histone acetyltransferase (RNA polymerase elongator complex component)
MNRGCPNRCVFCNERITAGDQPSPFSEDVIIRIVRQYLGCGGPKESPEASAKGRGAGRTEIAFYGGNFTGLSAADQRSLLDLAEPFIEKGVVDGIRISTRPDAIHPEQVDLFEAFHVDTVEIGAQSLMDDVLAASNRGHTAADVSTAVRILKDAGIAVGLHLMVGLPGDTREKFAATVEAAVTLAPHMVRIHPTLVLRDTPLAEAFHQGTYVPLTMEEALKSCQYARKRFMDAGIPVIRLGLQTTREMEQPGAVVAGPFHPAFGALVESAAFLDQASEMIRGRDLRNQWVTFHVPFGRESAFRGERNENIRILTERFHLAGIAVKRDDVFRYSTPAIRS